MYPSSYSGGMCMYTMKKCDSKICQFRSVIIRFLAFGNYKNFLFPDLILRMWCWHSRTLVTAITTLWWSPRWTQSQPRWCPCPCVGPSLASTVSHLSYHCLPHTKHSVYLTVKNSDPAKIAFSVTSMTSMSRWKIRVTQIMCDDTAILAPEGCLTYDMGDSGDIMSYNYDSGSGALINNQMFCHCIKKTDNYCDIALSSNGFDLGTDDSLTFGNNKQTGTTFGSSGMLNCESRVKICPAVI